MTARAKWQKPLSFVEIVDQEGPHLLEAPDGAGRRSVGVRMPLGVAEIDEIDAGNTLGEEGLVVVADVAGCPGHVSAQIDRDRAVRIK